MIPYQILMTGEGICFNHNSTLIFNSKNKKSIKIPRESEGAIFSEDFSEIAFSSSLDLVHIYRKDFSQNIHIPGHGDTSTQTRYDLSYAYDDKEFFYICYKVLEYSLFGHSHVYRYKRMRHFKPYAALQVWSKRFPHDEQIFDSTRKTAIIRRAQMAAILKFTDWQKVLTWTYRALWLCTAVFQ